MIPIELLLEIMKKDGTAICRAPNSHNINDLLLFSEPETCGCCTDIKQIKSIILQLETYQKQGKNIILALSYETAKAFDSDFITKIPAKGTPLLYYCVYHKSPQVIELPDCDIDFRPHFESELNFEIYEKAFQSIIKYIHSGDVYQVNYTFASYAQQIKEPEKLFLALYAQQRVNYPFYLSVENAKILSFSPELFFEISTDRMIKSSPMKGTLKRDVCAQEDTKSKENFKNDTKSQAENLMITDMVRNDLGVISEAGSVFVNPLFGIESYTTVHQMISTVYAKLLQNISMYDVFKATFPPASITGAPKIRAMEVIAQEELLPRGFYTGTMGCMLPDGSSCFNVAIRTLEYSKDKIKIGVGGGVIYDSNVKGEWEEALLKRTFTSLNYPSFSLFETMRFTLKEGFVFLDEHLKRLEISQLYFLRNFDLCEIKKQCYLFELTLRSQKKRQNECIVKMILDKNGNISFEKRSMSPNNWQKCSLKVMLSAFKTNSKNVFLYHKTTLRTLYQNELKCAQTLGFDEVLFFNEKEELTEGAISNIFIKKNGIWMTPAIKCGLLSGIWREKTIHLLSAQETLISKKMLLEADEIKIGNSVRGESLYSVVILT